MERRGFYVATEVQFSVIYAGEETNDINEFDFFIRMIPKEDVGCITVTAVPRYSLDKKKVKHINFALTSERQIAAYEVMALLAELKELEHIVQDVNLPAEEAEKRLKQNMLEKFNIFNDN